MCLVFCPGRVTFVGWILTGFWDRIGKEQFGYTDFGGSIKGQTLENIFSTYFSCRTDLQEAIVADLDVLERDMPYEYVPGVVDFIAELKKAGVPRAVVTSSNRAKMENVYRARPEILKLFDKIFTGEDFARSKPAPDCYLKGMEEFVVTANHTFIFEDSISGLQAAKSSRGNVIALATTNPASVVAPYAGLVIDNFKGVSITMLRNAFML